MPAKKGNHMKIGKKLKALRKEREMTLKELSEKSKVAIATLSRMEHDIMTGTLASHINICKALEVPLADFYQELESETKSVSLLRQKEAHDLPVSPKKSSVELLTPRITNKKMMATLIHIKKDGKTHKEENKPGIEKFIYILEGNIIAEIGKEKYRMVKGDSVYFEASLPHTFATDGKGKSIVLCVSSPPIL